MRIRHSLKAIIPVILLLASTRTVQAQGGPPMQGMPMPGGQMAGMPMPGMPMAGPQQIPGSYGAYPYQSPYQGMFEQTYQRDGTWFKNSVSGFGPNNRPRDWFMTLDYTRTRNPKMKGLFGAEGVPTYLQQQDPLSNDINPGLSSYNYFDAVHADIIPKLSTNGIKLSGGFWNPDDSGFLFSGGFQFQNEQDYDARAAALAGHLDTASALQYQRGGGGLGNPSVFNLGGRTDLDYLVNDILAPGSVFDTAGTTIHGVSGTTFQILDRTLLNLHSLPTYSGRTPFDVNGEAAPYDVQFLLKQSIATGGVNADWAFSPVYDNDRIKIRPVVGGRWFWIDETMNFDGVSTLLSYRSQGAAADTDIRVTGKVFLPNTGVAPTTTTIGTYAAPTTANGTSLDLLVYSYIKSQVITNLYGPEFGFHYEMGKRKGIHFSGATRVAAMFNSETIRLSGDNIGNFMGVEVLPDPVTGANIFGRLYNTTTRQGASLNAFNDIETGTHISPLLEQTVTAEIPIFDRLPVLRDIDILSDAKLSIGWTGLFIGEISDPNKSINYTSSPITNEFLSIKPGHTNFIQNTLNVGVNWNY